VFLALNPSNRDTQETQDTIASLHTDATNGLSESVVPALLQSHGYNEFSVAAPEPVLLKFAKTIYESPLILLLCGSATVSAIMGNVDDAISITVAVLIVLTGMRSCTFNIDHSDT
jgi:P-type Ca2+ transporter type 2C